MTTWEPRDPVAVVRENLAGWAVPHVELDVFATADAAAIVEQVDGFVRRHLGAGVAAYLFGSSSVGSTHGLVLTDGRRVVLKARPPPGTNPDLAFDRGSLRQVSRVQGFLAARGYPCPRTLLGPESLGRGLATVEACLDVGEPVDGHAPRARAWIAASLCEHIEVLRGMPDPPRLGNFAAPDDRLFPTPHSKLFEPSAADTGWVRALAGRARDITRQDDSAIVLGHCDWRVEHLRFSGDRLVASYDWDSLATRREACIVGGDAHGHTADWSQEQRRRVPTPAAIPGFIADYEAARGQPFTARQHRAARAWAVYWIAYGAWISIAPGSTEWPEDSWPALLRRCGEDLLR